MTIKIQLSEESINRAISELTIVKDNIENGLSQVIQMLTKEGAEIAQVADGDMATVTGEMVDATTGVISASGESAVIAEFGAGDAVMVPQFENSPDTPIFPGSYSLLEGTQEYYRYGSWHYKGAKYTEVPARHGLLDAKEHIQSRATDMALEVIKL